MKKSRVYIIVRNDDPCAFSDIAQERKFLELFERYHVPQVLAVIPQVVEDAHDDRPQTEHPLHENPQVIELLREYQQKGLIEIAQHGFNHQTNIFRPSRSYDSHSPDAFPGRPQRWLPFDPAHPDGYSEFNGLPLEEQRKKIVEGKAYLEKYFGPIESFIFPWNGLNRPCLELLRDAGFKTVPCGDDEHTVEGLLMLGCCDWNMDRVVQTMHERLQDNVSSLIQLSYHSWLICEEGESELRRFLELFADHPQVTFITPSQIAEKVPEALEFIKLRAEVVRKAKGVSQYLEGDHCETILCYRFSKTYYKMRLAKLAVGGAVLKFIHRHKIQWLSEMVSDLRHKRTLTQRMKTKIQSGIECITLGLKLSFIEQIRDWVGLVPISLKRFWGNRGDTRLGVCFVAENPNWGGVEVHTIQLIKYLLSVGHRVEYISARDNQVDEDIKQLECEGLLITYSSVSVSQQSAKAAALWRSIFWNIKSSILVLPATYTTFGSFSFLRAARRSFKRIVSIQHTMPMPLQPEATHKERLQRKIRMRALQRIAAVSHTIRESLIHDWGCPASKVVTIHSGVTPSQCNVSAQMRLNVRKALGFSEDAIVYGMMTRLSDEKGIDLALQGFARLREQEPAKSLFLVIAGEGEEEEDLKQQARELGVSDHVIWLGFQENPKEVYALLDAFLVTSREEGLPLSLIESMGAGVIPICFDVGGVSEVVSDPQLGWTIPFGHMMELTSAMRSVAEMSIKEKLGYRLRLRHHVLDSFKRETANASFEELFFSDKTGWNYYYHKIKGTLLSWAEFAKLNLRCSPFEEIREGLQRTHFEKDRQHAQPGERPVVCVIEESHNWGGAEAHTRMLLDYFVEQGYEVEYVSGRTNRMTPPEGVRVIKAEVSIFDDGPKIADAWLRLFKPLKSRILIFPTLDIVFARSLAFLKATRRAFDDVVYIEHTLPPELPEKTVKKYFNGRLQGFGLWWHKERLRRKLRSHGATRVVAVSDAVHQAFSDPSWDCAPEKITTIRNGIDVARFQLSEAQRKAARQVFNIPESAFVFGMVTRLSEEKGVDLAVRAFADYCAKPGVRESYLVIAGTGIDDEILQELAESLGVADQVRWLGFQKDPLDVYALMDAFVATSRVEGLPLALLEGMAAGAIPIIFRVGGMPEVVSDPSLGWVVPPQDFKLFAQAMQEVSQLSPQDVSAYRERIQAHITEHFDRSKMFGAFEQLIQLQSH